MDYNTEFNPNNPEHIEMQKKLLKLVKVIDDCIENIDSFYCYTMKRSMLAGSTDNWFK